MDERGLPRHQAGSVSFTAASQYRIGPVRFVFRLLFAQVLLVGLAWQLFAANDHAVLVVMLALVALAHTIAMPSSPRSTPRFTGWRGGLIVGTFIGFYLGASWGLRSVAINLELSQVYHVTLVLAATGVFRLVLLASARWRLL